MFMEAGSVITYSIYAPTELVQGMTLRRLLRLPRRVGDHRAASRSASRRRYLPLNDITSPTGKIGGAAQKRLGNGAVLHHVTMSYDMDGERWSRCCASAARR